MAYKAVILTAFGGPDVLRVENINELPEPQEGEVRIRVLACSASFTDTLIRRGIYPDVSEQPPFIPGYDMVGVVDKPGTGVTSLAVGDKVAALTITGAYAEYVVLPADQLVRVPENVDNADAVSLILTYVAAHQMLTRSAQVHEGDAVLIHGAGGAVGGALVQLGAVMKLRMFGTASESQHERLRHFGCDPIDYRNEDFVETIRAAIPQGLDAVFDGIGGDNLKRSVKVLGKEGKLVAYGSYNATSSRDLVRDFLRVNLWNILPWRSSATFYSIGAWHRKHPDWFKQDLTTLLGWLSEGKIKPFISRKMPLEEASAAHELLDKGAAGGKIVLLVGE
ncbi:alcohol dehydrogenase [Marinobacter santoriniensis NKSG1]|uniref:Alcohol dehydrogenase n=1 Tax=Marinobacter santoriniensis NKSG1 TaxID=1288826 RepID=M7CWJ2_9GAMM|nr:medium chain dehydrogenase/reductase family protein [Marinobacter santoriniensis]EMP56610.1 alcohol dehydrogenase [Marinobacter santoriniensis NKSG1]